MTRIRPLALVAIIALIASWLGMIVATRRCPDLAAHYWDDEVDRYCLGDCRTEDLQAFATLWERGDA